MDDAISLSNSEEAQKTAKEVLGYLNFAAGAEDPTFLESINFLFSIACDDISAWRDQEVTAWDLLRQFLDKELQNLHETAPPFRDVQQARAVIGLVFDKVIPAYREHHRDLLFHHNDHSLFRPFLIGRICEAVLRAGSPWDETDRIVRLALVSLNTFIGHRPVVTLENHKHEPYPHERVAPIPLYIRGAGVEFGPYHELVKRAIGILGQTDPNLLRMAYFNLDRLDELSLDPRACDFDHPANKRPNYYFGEWDPHQIDDHGFYRRFIIRQVVVDAILSRFKDEPELSESELLDEAAAVLAGTILMASGVSGEGPHTHDSDTSLATLLIPIAQYRDAFYEFLPDLLDSEHANRLRREEKQLQQPLGGARQHLNAELSRRRATQLEQTYLARLFAKQGRPEAASRLVKDVPVPSIRFACRIDCLLAEARNKLRDGRRSDASRLLDKTMQLIHRGIDCGAIVDPWNILGFDANFELFPSLENSIRDQRVDELIETIESIFNMYSRVWGEAAAVDDEQLCEEVASRFLEGSEWWRQFAAHEVSSVFASDSENIYKSAQQVAEALKTWHKAGAAGGDIRFWTPHVEQFDAATAYGLTIEALLEHDDFVASQALLVHWLERADALGLQHPDVNFCELTIRWISKLRHSDQDAWPLIRKLFDYYEANAGDFWNVPQFELNGSRRRRDEHENGQDEMQSFFGDQEEQGDDDSDELFDAAYENVVYRDSTDDGMEGAIFDTSQMSEDELEIESRRISERLIFLTCLAQLWRAASGFLVSRDNYNDDSQRKMAAMTHWRHRTNELRHELERLLSTVQHYNVSAPTGDVDDLLEYDRQRVVRDMLLEQIVVTSVELVDVSCFIGGAIKSLLDRAQCEKETEFMPKESPDYKALAGMSDANNPIVSLYSGIFSGRGENVNEDMGSFIDLLKETPLLYIPLARGGDPSLIIETQALQRVVNNLVEWMPRLGLLTETRDLIGVVQHMEQNTIVGAGAVSEFDSLYETAFKSIITSCIKLVEAEIANLVEQSDDKMPVAKFERHVANIANDDLIEVAENVTENMISFWLEHSQSLRLSSVEALMDSRRWRGAVDFIKKYGADLFNQRFLFLGNIRAILHEGVDTWIDQLLEIPYGMDSPMFVEHLGKDLPRRRAVRLLTIILEAIVDGYDIYRDYNATTTQSDRGEMLYSLLDFLRLKVSYDRLEWNLRPIVFVHEILVRHGHDDAARIWREGLETRFGDEAKRFVKRLQKHQKTYAMKMPSVADRIEAGFTKPMLIDRLCALVRPATDMTNPGAADAAFARLEQEAIEMTAKPTGAGFDLPDWLLALHEETDYVLRPDYEREGPDDIENLIPRADISIANIWEIFDQWDNDVPPEPEEDEEEDNSQD